MKAGDPLVLYPCSPHAHELFTMTNEGLIRLSSNLNLCLQAKGGLSTGNEIVTYHCSQGGINRRHETFTMDNDGRIRAKAEPDLCMNVEGGDLNSGAKLILWKCSKGLDAPNELFKYAGGMILLKSNEALRFNVAGADIENVLQPITLWHCQPHDHELFEFTEAGALRLQRRPDMCVNAENGLQASHRLVLWPCTTPLGKNERWKHSPRDSTIHSIDLPSVGFNAKGGGMAQGDELVLWWLHESQEL
jgi:hypothetical protein